MEVPNYTQVPNLVMDRMNEWTGAQVKVMLAICRKTIGWHKESDAISYSQLQKMTGLGRDAISAALVALESEKLIEIERVAGKTNRIDLCITSRKTEQVQSENPTSTSRKTGHTKETPKETSKRNDQFASDFEDWWDKYPNKTGKKAAYQKYCARIREGASHDDLIRALAVYRKEKEGTETKYIQHAKTFLGPSEYWKECLDRWQPGKRQLTPAQQAAKDAVDKAIENGIYSPERLSQISGEAYSSVG
jgi:phage replication O-like protein O